MANTVINVVVTQKNPVTVSSNGMGGSLTTQQPVTLKNSMTMASSGGGIDMLVDLLDVVSNGNIVDGSTIVYYAANNTFVIEPLPFQDITTLDCGSF
jgi:hypothetical protein